MQRIPLHLTRAYASTPVSPRLAILCVYLCFSFLKKWKTIKFCEKLKITEKTL